MHRALGYAHATAHHHLDRARRRLFAGEAGQGTVEYVGLILLMAAIMAVVAKATGGSSIPDKIVGQLTEAIDSVGGAKK